MPRDSVDSLLASWAGRRPELDFSPIAVLTRLARVRRHLDIELEGVFAAHGLEPATFALLAILDRLDADRAGLSRARLMEELGMPAAALDAAVDTVRSAGLVTETGAGYALTD